MTAPQINPQTGKPAAPAVNGDSPATDLAVSKRTRIPMSVPRQRLAVPEIPGYHVHWFLTRNVARAMQGGYVPVNQSETIRTATGIASANQNESLGTNVTHGGLDSMFEGQPEVLHLMKCPQEYFEEDQQTLAGESEKLLAALRVGVDAAGDNSQRYVGRGNHNIFKPRKIGGQ